MCPAELIEAEKQRLLSTIMAGNKFKREFIADWIAAAGKTGNVINGKWGIDPKYNSPTNNFRVGPTNKLMFETLSMNYDDINELWRNSAVEKLWFGLKTDWETERRDDGFLPCCIGSPLNFNKYDPAVASRNGDREIFKSVLNAINSPHDAITGIGLIVTRTATGLGLTELEAEDEAKSKSLPSADNTKIGIHDVTGTTLAPDEGHLVLDSILYDTHLVGSTSFSSATSYEISMAQQIAYEYNGGYIKPFTQYKATVTTHFIEYRTFSSREIFNADSYYNSINANWNTTTKVENICVGEKHCTDYYCYDLNINGYRDAYSRTVYFLESKVDWLIRNGDSYNIDYVKFLASDVIDIVSVLQLALNIWVEEDDGGFWGTSWGMFFTAIIFVVAIVLMIVLAFFTFGSTVGPMLGAILYIVGSTAIAYGAAAITQNPMMFKALMAASAVISFGASIGASEAALSSQVAAGTTTQSAAASASMNNVATGALELALTVHGLMEVLPNTTQGEYYDDMDAEDKQRAALYMDDSCGDTMYYNYDTQPPFTDKNFSYDTMS